MTPSHFYVTTPIYYINAEPHIGHAYTTLLADTLARYHRLRGIPTWFLTGTDEHGQKVLEVARKQNLSPQAYSDRIAEKFRAAWRRLEISHDDFIRTTEPRHTKVVEEILQDLHDRGEIYSGDYEGWYSVSEERFYTEKELVDGKSPEGKPVEKIVEKNYFFRMSRYQDWLIEHIKTHPEFIQPEFRRNETLGFLRQPLGDLCISRPKSRLPWGVELPFDRDYVCYVWFDALVNYVSAIGYRRDEATFRKWWPVSWHLIGKDIITTHTVYWPTMLKAMGVEMPRSFFAHGWWLSGGEKMAKSVGNVIDPLSMADRYGVDALRYHLMADMSLGHDATFTEESFILRYNADLANDLGNLVSRTLTMIARSFEGRMPAPGHLAPEDEALRDEALAAAAALERHVDAMTLDRGIAEVLSVVRSANRYFDRQAPWKLAKEGHTERLATVMNTTAECLRVVAGLLHPVMPMKMAELRGMLGAPAGEPNLAELRVWGKLAPGQPIGALAPLFPRIEPAAKGAEAPGGGKPAAPVPVTDEAELIDIDTFFRTKLRVATILAAEPVPKADKLLRLEISLGAEKRQLVAGIAQHYKPEEIVGKKIIVVANLKPATIRGVESRGMLLAAKSEGSLRLLTVDGDIEPGSSVG